jgi:hypothetical protein
MDAATLRADLPEFADIIRYPDATVNFWLGVGAKLLRADAWADMLDHGLELYTAHHLTLWRRDMDAAANGGAPGQSAGQVSSKTVDKVSVSYDVASTSWADAGYWNQTTYGKQFWQLQQLAGMGGASAWGGGYAVFLPTPPGGWPS